MEEPTKDGKSHVSPSLPPELASRKRRRLDDEEKEIALFRRVRIRTEIEGLSAEGRNNPSTSYNNSDDPYSDPGLLDMLDAERNLENELLSELQDELEREAEVEEELNQRMMLDELPSDSEEESSDNSDNNESDSSEDIDMDYRFS
jgi:hypothetical protein